MAISTRVHSQTYSFRRRNCERWAANLTSGVRQPRHVRRLRQVPNLSWYASKTHHPENSAPSTHRKSPLSKVKAAVDREDAVSSGVIEERERAADNFVWTKCWLPLTGLDYLDPKTPTAIKVLGYDLVIWQDAGKVWRCFRDLCPHRAAPLSEGAINPATGDLRCAYHGWEFSGSGSPTSIPQSPGGKSFETATASPRACAQSFPTAVAHGLLWVWLESGDSGLEASTSSPLPSIPSTDDKGREWFAVSPWYVRDMRVDYVALMENSADPAHVHFTHAGFIGSPDRAGPITVHQVESGEPGVFEFLCDDPKKSTFRHLKLHPPCMLWASSEGMSETGELGLLYFIVPVAPGRCRLMSLPFATSPSFRIPAMIFHKAPWIRHLFNHTVAAQDAAILHRQATNMAAADFPGWRKGFYLPTKSDSGVMVLRKWLESTAGGGISWGPNVDKEREHSREATQFREELFDNFHDHTQHCRHCRRALAWVRMAGWIIGVIAVLSLGALPSLALQGSGRLAVASGFCAVLCLIGFKVLKNVEKAFIQTSWSHAQNKKLLV